MKEYDEEKRQLALDYMYEGKAVFFRNELNEAALLLQNAIHLFRELEDYENLVLALNLMGVIYGSIGNDAAAIDYFLEGLSYTQEHHFDSYTCLFYNNIGNRYQQLGRHEEAISYFLKAEAALKSLKENPSERISDRVSLWTMISFLNLGTSYMELSQLDLAEKYVQKAEAYMQGSVLESHGYTFLITKCRLYWLLGKRDFVYTHLPELMESGYKDKNASDYIQDMTYLCDLLMWMEAYENWRDIILSVRDYAIEQKSVHFYMIVTEMWMRYCKAIGNHADYRNACISLADLYQRQKKVSELEKAAAIDIRIQLREKENERRAAEQKANQDFLTGLGNRYLMEADIQAALKNALEKGTAITIGILDIDCFKQMNDTYGHIQGDYCLRTVAQILAQAIAGLGKAYRFGGDEFILLLNSSEEATIQHFAKRVKDLLHEEEIANSNSTVIPELTLSQGYSCFVPEKTENSSKRLIGHADKALYQVKEHGKNSYLVIMEDAARKEREMA